MRLFRAISKIALCLCIAGCASGWAQFTTFATPTSAYTTGTTLIAITAPDCTPGSPPTQTTISSLTDGAETVSFSSTMIVNTAGVFPVCGGGWASWGVPPNTESSTPRVVDTTATTLTLTLTAPAKTFGFEIEPVTDSTVTITATFYNGSTVLGTIALPVSGDAGARLEAASSSGTPITSVVISGPSSHGMGLAQVRYTVAPPATVPTLNTAAFGGLGLLVAAVGVLLARHQQSRGIVRP